MNAQSLQGFDPVWLRNAVLEPLEEADVKVERGMRVRRLGLNSALSGI